MMVVNGVFPGPVIRMNEGDRLVVNVTNKLTEPTAMHWHGMFQNGTSWNDGTSAITQCPIPPGQSYVYNFTVAGQRGTYWYHSHYAAQYSDGIVGPLIIHGADEDATREQYDYDQVVLLQDYYHGNSSDLVAEYLASGNENSEPVPDNGLIQGQNYFDCSNYADNESYRCENDSRPAVLALQHGKRYRLRLINVGSFANFEVSVDAHPLTIIEADGTLTKPYTVNRFEIATAQRYSVVLHANQSADTNYWFRARMNEYCFAYTNPVLDPLTKALITYSGSDATPHTEDWSQGIDTWCKGLNASLLEPLHEEQAPTSNVLYELRSQFMIGARAIDLAYMNETHWTPNNTYATLNQAVNGLKNGDKELMVAGDIANAFSKNQLVIAVPDEQVVDIVLMNFDDGAHPFHLHGHVFWVMASSDGQYFPWSSDLYSKINSTEANEYTRNPLKRDTVMVEAFGWVLLRFRADHAGMWIFHCHITWHLEAGLAMQFMTRTDLLEETVLPEDITSFCQVE